MQADRRIFKIRKKDIENLVLLAEYHDIGKAGLINELFQKEGPLTSEEWQRTKRHPELGFKIVSASAKLFQIGREFLPTMKDGTEPATPKG